MNDFRDVGQLQVKRRALKVGSDTSLAQLLCMAEMSPCRLHTLPSDSTEAPLITSRSIILLHSFHHFLVHSRF